MLKYEDIHQTRYSVYPHTRLHAVKDYFVVIVRRVRLLS